MTDKGHIQVENLTMAYGQTVVQSDIAFSVSRGSVFVVMGDSGSGKSTLMRHMLGLHEPVSGRVLYDGESFYDADTPARQQMMRRWGVLYQSGALWTDMTLRQNVALPLEEFTELPRRDITELVTLKLELVGLGGFENYYPAQLSGGMKKRAALARAMSLDPEILFFDEPSAGLDPISARHLDELILKIRHNLGTTIIVVTHELESIFTIADDAIFLDGQSHRPIATGSPRQMLERADDPKVVQFLTRSTQP